MNPRVDVRGPLATGVWYILGPWTESDNGHSIWMSARYDARYRKVDGLWKIQYLKVSVRMLADRPALAASADAG